MRYKRTLGAQALQKDSVFIQSAMIFAKSLLLPFTAKLNVAVFLPFRFQFCQKWSDQAIVAIKNRG